MAPSNTRSSSEPFPVLAILLSLAFIVMSLVIILWVALPSNTGYVLSPYTDNPTPITVAP